MNDYLMGKQIEGWHSQDAKEITFVVTQECNLSCKYCYMVGKNNTHKMTFETAKKAVDFFIDNKTELFDKPYIILDFIGGEPLLEIDLIDKIVDYFKIQSYKKGLDWFGRYKISMSTNGLLYSSKKVQRFIAKNSQNISIGISIDGNKEKHNLQRVYSDGSGSYYDVEKNVKLWLEQYPNASTKVTIGHEDLPYLADSIIHLWKMGIKEVPANVVFEDAWQQGDSELFEKQLIILADYIIEHRLWKAYNTTLFSDRIGFKQSDDVWDRNFCGTGKSFTVDSEGKIYPCVRYLGYSLQNKESIEFGNIYDGIIKDRIRPFKIMTARLQSSDRCLECPISSECAYCQAFNYDSSKMDTNFDRATYICEMHKARVRANNYYWSKLYNLHGISRNPNNEVTKYFEKQLFFMLDNRCVKLCSNYKYNNINHECMDKKTILKGLTLSREDFFQPVFLYSDITDVDFLFNDKDINIMCNQHIIKHFIPYNQNLLDKIVKYVNYDDIVLVIDKHNINYVKKSQVKNCILLIEADDVNNISKYVSNIIMYFTRINLKYELLDANRLSMYEEQLDNIIEILKKQYNRNEIVTEINVVTDRLYLDKMINCFAGEKNLSLSPEGFYYCCPAFYYEDKNKYNLELEMNKNSIKMTKYENAYLCHECDAYQCERCIYQNKKNTLEYNIPSELQCKKSHLERLYTVKLIKFLNEKNSKMKIQEIQDISYDDPIQVLVEKWCLD